jgi:glycosyltransferase involved in cell wall biosynthesis
MLGRPVVLNYRSGQAPHHLSSSAIARSALASVDMNVVPSRFLRDVFAGFGIDAAVIPNIVDLGRFVFREREPLRPRIVSTRNFESLYNVACTIRAFRIVQDRWPDATLTLVGGGHEEQSLKALVAEFGLRQVVFAGRVGPDEIARHYDANDIYVQSPNIDNMPTSIIEAFASGLPVVSTNVGGVPAMLTDKVHGLLSPADDHEALGAHIIRLIDDPVMAKRLTQAAYATCQRCTWVAVRELWLQVYQRVLHASCGRLSMAGTGHDAA